MTYQALLGKHFRIRYALLIFVTALSLGMLAFAAGPRNDDAHVSNVDYGVIVWVHQVEAIDNFDEVLWFSGGPADFYAELTVSGDRHRTSHTDDSNVVIPNWRHEIGKTAGQMLRESIPIDIRIMDHDPNPDDHADINPARGRRDLNLRVNFRSANAVNAGTLVDRNTGAILGVLRPNGERPFGPNGAWESMAVSNSLPGQVNHRASKGVDVARRQLTQSGSKSTFAFVAARGMPSWSSPCSLWLVEERKCGQRRAI